MKFLRKFIDYWCPLCKKGFDNDEVEIIGIYVECPECGCNLGRTV
jgi:DNA-directed RNA polymerase subunit RPC12/RpoP